MVDGHRTQKRERHSIRATPFSRSFVHILPVVAVKRVVQYSHACYSLTHPHSLCLRRVLLVSVPIKREREWKSRERDCGNDSVLAVHIYSVLFSGWFRLKGSLNAKKKRRKNCILHSVNVKSWSTKEWSIRPCMIRWSTSRSRKVYKVEGESCAVKISREKKRLFYKWTHTPTQWHRIPFRMNQ